MHKIKTHYNVDNTPSLLEKVKYNCQTPVQSPSFSFGTLNWSLSQEQVQEQQQQQKQEQQQQPTTTTTTATRTTTKQQPG